MFDAIPYFFTNLLLLNFLLALVAFLLGLLLGWLLWAKYKKQVSSYKSEVDDLKKKNADLEATIRDLKSKLSDCEASLECDAKASEEQEACPRSFFNDAIESGKMREDEKYGLLYTSTPDKIDDLTRIKGVAGVLNKTLNDYGIYTFRQIALWTPQICSDFSEKIAFPGRVERDNWIEQCKTFHKEKYGEVI